MLACGITDANRNSHPDTWCSCRDRRRYHRTGICRQSTPRSIATTWHSSSRNSRQFSRTHPRSGARAQNRSRLFFFGRTGQRHQRERRPRLHTKLRSPRPGKGSARCRQARNVRKAVGNEYSREPGVNRTGQPTRSRWRSHLQPALLPAVPRSSHRREKRGDRRTATDSWQLLARLAALSHRLELALTARTRR